MHYAEYKVHDPSVVRAVIETFPFAAIMANDGDGPKVAQAPLTYRSGRQPVGAIEFHLAKANPIAPLMLLGAPVTVLVNGPGAPISPSWYSQSYPTPDSDRSRTAPTYNYLSLVIHGRLEYMSDLDLQTQIHDLVTASEPEGGWRTRELAPDLWEMWRQLIQGYRMEIESFDLTAKFSTGDAEGDKPGVIAGLNSRAVLQDRSMAALLAGYDGSPQSLQRVITSLQKPIP
jgi:transcriptional regulator